MGNKISWRYIKTLTLNQMLIVVVRNNTKGLVSKITKGLFYSSIKDLNGFLWFVK